MICNDCKTEKPDEEFVFRNKTKGIRKRRCKACQKLLSRKHYENNKQAYIEKSLRNGRLQRVKNRQFVNELKLSPCSQCHRNYPVEAMEFDHLHGKVSEVSTLVKNGVSINRIKQEIAKCDLVCANCHRIRTYQRRQATRTKSKAG